MLQAPSLGALAGIRHAFFTRDGGVSQGLYATLNGGTGSRDLPGHVTENRNRMAAALGVRPQCLLTAYQTHSPDVVTIERALAPAGAPARRCHRHPDSRAGDCGDHRRLRPGPVRGRERRGDRRRPCRVARCLERRAGSNDWSHGRLWRRPHPMVAAIGPMIRQPNYEVGARLHRPIRGRRCRQRTLLPAIAARRARALRSRRLYRCPPVRCRHQRVSRMSAIALMAIPSGSSAIGARPIAMSRTTGVTSMP